MRYVTFLALILISSSSFAEDWRSQTDLDASRAGSDGGTSYVDEAVCVSSEAEPCFLKDGKDLRYHTIQNLRRGAFEAASTVTSCTDSADCISQIADSVAKCGDATYIGLWGDLDDNSSRDAQGQSNMDDLESWCTRKALIDVLELDTALKTAHDASEAAKAADMATRASAKGQRELDSAACVTVVNRGTPPMTVPEITQCLTILVKEVYEKEVATGDL